MAFALTIAHLKEMLALPGCPICRRGRRAAARAVDSFLWESVNDPDSRGPFLDAYGLCPDHTRLMAAADISSTGQPLATNIIFEHLGRVAARDLRSWERSRKFGGAVLTSLWERLRGRLSPGMVTGGGSEPLSQRARCPICITAGEAELTMLMSLFEALEKGTEDISTAYTTSDGVCLAHLRSGLARLSAGHPVAARILVESAAGRLEAQSAGMKEFIRKNNWEYREEKVTPAEANAWRRTLTFFTGLAGDEFTHKKDEWE